MSKPSSDLCHTKILSGIIIAQFHSLLFAITLSASEINSRYNCHPQANRDKTRP